MNNASIHIHPRRVWLWLSIHVFTSSLFQSTHPRRVWQRLRLTIFRYQSFNPHTHAGCDPENECFVLKLTDVSIHTPTQGVTFKNVIYYNHTNVSIHTPTQGVTFKNVIYYNHTNVSIHTPTQGVTRYIVVNQILLGVSIHTPTQGVTRCGLLWLVELVFQSTHPRRVWLYYFPSLSDYVGFNPHTHAGCDTLVLNEVLWYRSFNPHTHAGCDWEYKEWQSPFICFNPHTHAGCDT